MSTAPKKTVGWKQQGNTAYESLLLRRALYEVEDTEFDDYRVERDRIVADIPRELCAEENDITLYAHFCSGSWDWYVAVWDPDSDEAYCFVTGLKDEWETEWLRGIETTRMPLRMSINGGEIFTVPEGPWVECDTLWVPITFGELMARREGAL